MRANKTSGSIAKDRLEHILLSEKMQIPPDVMAQMRRELRRVIHKYVSAQRLDIQIRLTNIDKQGEKDVKTIQIKGL